MDRSSAIHFALLSTLCSVGCGSDDGPPPIAGAWVHCLDDACKETLKAGWYFPDDGGAVRRVGESDAGELCAADTPEPLFENSTWEETADGVIVHDVIGIGEFERKRHGDFLETLTDGFVFQYPPPEEYPYMAKAKLGRCK